MRLRPHKRAVVAAAGGRFCSLMTNAVVAPEIKSAQRWKPCRGLLVMMARSAGEYATMGTESRDPFEQGKLAKLRRQPDHDATPHNPYPEGTEQHRRWEAGYKFVQQGLAAV
jgi:hypothetical protein